MSDCKHTKTSPSWAHVTCDECHMVFTDNQWGVASNKWFKNINEAEFYKEHGRVPE